MDGRAPPGHLVFDFADALLRAGASFVEDFGKEHRFGDGILAGQMPRRAPPLGSPWRRSLCRRAPPSGDVRANVEQDLEVAAVAGLAAGQVEGQRQAIEIKLQVDFAGKPAA